MPLHNSVSNKALGICGNEELRREGQYSPRCKKAVFRVEGLLTYTWIISEMNHPMLYSKRWFEESSVGVCHQVLRILTLWKMTLFWSEIPVFRPDLHTHFQTWPNLACLVRASEIVGKIPQFPAVLFSCFLSLRSRRSKGKGKGIRTRDRAREGGGRRGTPASW